MKKSYFILVLCTIISLKMYSQGCVGMRSPGGSGMFMQRPNSPAGPNYKMGSKGYNAKMAAKKGSASGWTFSASNRYFQSFRHFSGTDEQKQRYTQGTEVINKSYTLDLSVTRIFNQRWSMTLGVPVSINDRSSLYEHSDGQRHSTGDAGLGDIRVTAYRWLMDPKKSKNFNLQGGLGVKLPTGNYRANDYFITSTTGSRVLGPVDQSIQLGDGGLGINTELNGFYNLGKKVSLYTNLFYLVNPRETNGISTARGRTPSAASVTYGSNVMSVPDQYMARLGANITISKFTLGAGARIDGVPVKDLAGGSNGFRRPGYVITADPSLSYRTKKFTAFVNVPVALERNRLQSVPDKIRTDLTKTYFVGDAAFADYVVNFGVSFSFMKKIRKPAGNNRQFNNYRGHYHGGGYSSPQRVRVISL